MINNSYTIFVGSMYYKSFTNKAMAQKVASQLKRDGAKRVKINKN